MVIISYFMWGDLTAWRLAVWVMKKFTRSRTKEIEPY